MNLDKMHQLHPGPGVAAVLSFIFSGLGQLYNGQIIKGLVVIFFSALGMFVFIIGSILLGLWLVGRVIFAQQLILGLGLFIIALISICVLGAYSIIDAYRIALKK